MRPGASLERSASYREEQREEGRGLTFDDEDPAPTAGSGNHLPGRFADGIVSKVLPRREGDVLETIGKNASEGWLETGWSDL